MPKKEKIGFGRELSRNSVLGPVSPWSVVFGIGVGLGIFFAFKK